MKETKSKIEKIRVLTHNTKDQVQIIFGHIVQILNSLKESIMLIRVGRKEKRTTNSEAGIASISVVMGGL